MPEVKLSTYQRLRDAAIRGVGMKLNPSEVKQIYGLSDVQQGAAEDDRVQGQIVLSVEEDSSL